jgi:hypothetical protein
LVQELAHPGAEIVRHAKPGPGEIRKLGGRTAAGSAEHHDRCADIARRSQLRAHARLEGVGRNVLFGDGLLRQDDDVEIRQSGRYRVEIGADGSVDAGDRLARCLVRRRVEEQALHDLARPVWRYDIRRLDVGPGQRNERQCLKT